MRTSLDEIKNIEDWLLKRGDLQERLLTEARIHAEPQVKANADWQLKAYQLIRSYGREKLRGEIAMIHQQLFHTSKYQAFQNKVKSIFKHS